MKRSQIAVVVGTLLLAGAAHSQEKFPTKNIRMLVPFAAGSQTDILARWIDEPDSLATVTSALPDTARGRGYRTASRLG